MTAKLEEIIHQLERLSPEEQQAIAAQIQELLEDAEDVALAREVRGEATVPFEEAVAELIKKGKLPADWKTR